MHSTWHKHHNVSTTESQTVLGLFWTLQVRWTFVMMYFVHCASAAVAYSTFCYSMLMMQLPSCSYFDSCYSVSQMSQKYANGNISALNPAAEKVGPLPSRCSAAGLLFVHFITKWAEEETGVSDSCHPNAHNESQTGYSSTYRLKDKTINNLTTVTTCGFTVCYFVAELFPVASMLLS